MSIAKAALVWFYEGWKNTNCGFQPTQWNWGDFGISHDIIDIAGADHASANTTLCVSRALARSPLWKKTFIRDFYPGISNGAANIYEPSDLGKKWFDEYKKNSVNQ